MFFEYQTDKTSGNLTIKNSEMYETKAYGLFYYLVCDSIFKIWIPVCILLYTNYCIYNVIKKQSKLFVPGDEHGQYNRKVQFLMLFGVVILLTTTNLYRFFTNLHNMTIHHYLECCMVHRGNEIALTVSSVLLTINSSVNCFIYIAASKDFRYYVLDYTKRPFHFFWQCKIGAKREEKRVAKGFKIKRQEINLQVSAVKPGNKFGSLRLSTQTETISSTTTKHNIGPVVKVFFISQQRPS